MGTTTGTAQVRTESRESAGGAREKTRSGESEAGTSSRYPHHRT